jgi:predicted ATPase
LAKRFDDAERRQGSLVFVAGEAGVGKTRLAVEFMKIAKARGASTLYARAVSGSSLQPYSVWVECVRQFASEATVLSFLEICGDVSEPMLRLLPEMKMQARPQTSLGAGAQEQQRQQSVFELVGVSPMKYFDAIAQFLFRLSSRRTLCVMLDDFQWCDQSSLDLLQYISSNGLGSHPILILCLYRDIHLNAVNRPLFRLTSGPPGGRGRNAAIKLDRLDRATATKLLTGPSNALRLTDEFCELLYRKTGGNPLFMKETLTLMAQQGVLFAKGSSFFAKSEISGIQVPNSVKDVIRQRLIPVDHEIKEALQVAAVIGETFDFEVLQRITSIEKERLFGILQAAASSGLVHLKPGVAGEIVYG